MKTEERHPKLSPATNGLRDSAPFTVEESIVMRAFAAGKSDKQVSVELRIPLPSFHRLLRNLMEKTGARDWTGIHVWALRQRQRADSREAERDYQWRRPA
jgi:DNA-binding NarL/FixJ family response regulator